MNDAQLTLLSDIQTALMNIIKERAESKTPDIALVGTLTDSLAIITQLRETGEKNRRIAADLDGQNPTLKPTDLAVGAINSLQK